MTQTDLDLTYTISKARYAKRMVAVRPFVDGTGWKTLAALIISEMPGVRWSNRERAYLCSASRAAKFEAEMHQVAERRSKQRAEENGQ